LVVVEDENGCGEETPSVGSPVRGGIFPQFLLVLEEKEAYLKGKLMTSTSIEPLLEGARRIVTVCAAVQAGEQVVIVTDHARPAEIGLALARAVDEAGGVATICTTEPVPSGSEPPEAVRAAMGAAEVILAPTSGALYHTAAVQGSGARFLGLTAFIPEVLMRGGVFADFPALAWKADRLAKLLSNASEARVTAPGGTDLKVQLDGRRAVPITGMARNPGERTGCPDIEAFIAPLEDRSEGVVVVDASASIAGVLDEPITLQIEQGRAVSIEGGEGARLIREALEATGTPAVYTLAELAFGLNPVGIIRGVIVEDEGVAGTGHIALGSNIHFGGTNAAPLHLDFVYHRPALWLDGERVEIEGGKAERLYRFLYDQ
jgi:leucyl aminopeptidase (aminopeptidase T)